MTIRVHPNRQKVPFANFVKNSRGTNEYDDESETDQSSSFEGIYTDDSSEEEVRLYVLETIPKVGALFEADQRDRRDDDQSTPCVLAKGEVVEWVSISIYLFSTLMTLGKSPWSNTKLNCYRMPNQSKLSKGGGIQDTLQW